MSAGAIIRALGWLVRHSHDEEHDKDGDILREMVEERDRQLAEAVKVHMDFVQERAGAQAQKGVKLTDEQALRVLNAIREAGL